MKFKIVYLVTCRPSPFWHSKMVEVLGIFSTKELADNAIFHKINDNQDDSLFWATKFKDYHIKEIEIDDELKYTYL